MNHLVLMCLLLFIHTSSQSQIHYQRSTEGKYVSLYCKHEGKVLWSKDRDGNNLTILTAERSEKIIKHSPDPHNRYSALDDFSLHIKNLSVSDSGIYYCNETATVNLTVTSSDLSKSTASSNSSTEDTTTPAEISTTSVSETSNTYHTDQHKSTQETPPSENSSVTSSSSQPNTSTTDLSTTSTRSSTRTEETKQIISSATSTANTSPSTESFPESIKIALAVSGGVVFVVLVLFLWAWIKRKATLSKKKENIYETVDDSDFTAQPVPLQKPNDAVYYLAGDPDIVKLGQIKETDDHTYTLISQSKENITEQEEGVPLYSIIKVDTINQP